MGKIATTLVALVVAVIWHLVWGEDSKTTACLREIDRIEAAYRSQRPKAESRKAIEKTLTHARTWCKEGKLKDASSAMDVAAFLCVASKGCNSLLDQAKRQRQSAR
jgi:hypothetical protein